MTVDKWESFRVWNLIPVALASGGWAGLMASVHEPWWFTCLVGMAAGLTTAACIPVVTVKAPHIRIRRG